MLQPPGIHNSGNICFASSVLQCLLNQQLFRRVLEDVSKCHMPTCPDCKEGRCMIAALHHLSRSYQYTERPVVLQSYQLLSSLTSVNSSLSPGREHDAQFLTFLMELLMCKLSPEKHESFKNDTHMKMSQTVCCKKCGNSSVLKIHEAYIELYATSMTHLTERSHSHNIRDLFLDTLENENICDAKCSRCGELGLTRHTMPTTSPRVLLVHVTKYDTGFGYLCVLVPDAFLHFSRAIHYRIVGLIIHHKLGLSSGHYTSYFLHHNQNQWFHADDEKVSSLPLLNVLQEDPFLLIYELYDGTVHALSISQCDRLLKNHWLTDEVLKCKMCSPDRALSAYLHTNNLSPDHQCYLQMICADTERKGQGSAFAISSQFIEKLRREGIHSVQRWYTKVNLIQKDTLLVPINHAQSHWTLLVVDIHKKAAMYFDSYGQDSPAYWDTLRYYIIQFSTLNKNERQPKYKPIDII